GIPELRGKYALLPTGIVDSYIQRIQELLASGSLHISIREGRLCRENISDSSPEEVRNLLFSYRPDSIEVTLLWLSDRYGIVISFTDFVRYYDDLWFPSRDDLWITNESFDWLIELNHEETLTLFQQDRDYF